MLGVKLEINSAAGSPRRVTTKAETGINEASGGSPPDEATSTAACEACFAERHMISPVDPLGAKARVWGTGENADMCGLCVELWDISGQDENLTAWADPHRSVAQVAQWKMFLTALAMLKVERGSEISVTAKDIKERACVIQACQFFCLLRRCRRRRQGRLRHLARAV